MPEWLVGIVIVAGLIAAWLLIQWLIARTMHKVLAAMNELPPHQNVTQISQKAQVYSGLVGPALQLLQRQALVTSRQKPSRVRGTAAASLDLVTYTITDKGRQHARARQIDQGLR